MTACWRAGVSSSLYPFFGIEHTLPSFPDPRVVTEWRKPIFFFIYFESTANYNLVMFSWDFDEVFWIGESFLRLFFLAAFVIRGRVERTTQEVLTVCSTYYDGSTKCFSGITEATRCKSRDVEATVYFRRKLKVVKIQSTDCR